MISELKRLLPAGVRRRLGRWRRRERPFSYVVSVVVVGGKPCRFHVAGAVERERVLELGAEAEFLRSSMAEVSPGEVILDIGPCVGLFALPAAQRGGQVNAFEPDPEFRAALAKNVDMNGLERRVTVKGWAVTDKPGKAALFTDDREGNSPSLARFGERRAVEVEAGSFDDALAGGEIPWPNLEKMDIEGTEIFALGGRSALIGSPRTPRCLFVELHPAFLPGFGSGVDECLALIESASNFTESSQVRAGQIHCIFRRLPQATPVPNG